MTCDHPHPRMAEGQEVLGGHAAALPVRHSDARHPRGGCAHRVDEHHGDARREECAELPGRGIDQGPDHAEGAPSQQPRHPVAVRFRERQDDIDSRRRRFTSDPGYQQVRPRSLEMGDHEVQRVGEAALVPCVLALGPGRAGVADGLHGFHDLRAGLRRDVRSASQHLGHGGDARTGGLGHQGQCGTRSGWSRRHGERLAQPPRGPAGGRGSASDGVGRAMGGRNDPGVRWPPAPGCHTDGVGAGTYSNQSKSTEPCVAYIPITRPVKPQAISVERSSRQCGRGAAPRGT